MFFNAARFFGIGSFVNSQSLSRHVKSSRASILSFEMHLRTSRANLYGLAVESTTEGLLLGLARKAPTYCFRQW